MEAASKAVIYLGGDAAHPKKVETVIDLVKDLESLDDVTEIIGALT